MFIECKEPSDAKQCGESQEEIEQEAESPDTTPIGTNTLI